MSTPILPPPPSKTRKDLPLRSSLPRFSINGPKTPSIPAPTVTVPDREITAEDIALQLYRIKGDELNESSMFVSRPASEWVEEAATQPDPVPLWGESLWFEHEVACLFADTNTGKSILAVQIAEDVAREGHRVVYFDFEMSAKQFQMRYTDPDTGRHHEFSENLLRVEMNPSVSLSRDIVAIAKAMRSHIEHHYADVVIIDNLSWLCNEAESGEAAGELMQILVRMKREMNISILVLAHTPKRSTVAPLTQNSLAGSKKIANFMDSIFAIGRDLTAMPHGRYVKQIKVRSAPMVYHEGNVMRYTLGKVDAMLQFIPGEETAIESELLEVDESRRKSVVAESKEQIRRLRSEGKSLREIADITGIPKTTLYRSLKD